MEETAYIGRQISVRDADEAYSLTLGTVGSGGLEIQGAKSLSIGSEQRSTEILDFVIRIENPHDYLVFNPARRINLPAAVARFVWMMAGSDRLADIAFYEPKSKAFSDDGVAVPGSNYGQRILRPRPGCNQLEAII